MPPARHERQYPVWLWPNLLSMDAPIVAAVWQEILARAVGLHALLPNRLLLFLAVWAVYLADRLLDTRSVEYAGESARHRFSRAHVKSLRIVLAAVLAAGAAGAAFLRPNLRGEGMLVGGAILIYFALIHFGYGDRRLPKELLVAVIFVAGTILAPWTRAQDKLSLLPAGAAFLFCCFLNLALIEGYEWTHLRRLAFPQPHPITRAIYSNLPAWAVAGILASALGSLTSWTAGLRLALASSAVADGGLLLLFYCQDYLGDSEFRVMADLALISPAPALLLRQM